MHILIGLAVATVLIILWAQGSLFACVFLSIPTGLGALFFISDTPVQTVDLYRPASGRRHLGATRYYRRLFPKVPALTHYTSGCRTAIPPRNSMEIIDRPIGDARVLTDIFFVGVTLAYLVPMWRSARPDRWMASQFILSVAGGILFMVAWNTFTHPLGKDDQSGKALPYVAVVAGYWFNKSIMFCIVWARFGLPAARSMRLLILARRPPARVTGRVAPTGFAVPIDFAEPSRPMSVARATGD